jgi:D-alanyl-D-alanine carboxypeptidase
LQAKLSQDSVHAAGTDLKLSLTQFLCDDLAGNIGIQKAITHHLTDYFPSTTIVAFGTALAANQSRRALLMKKSPELEIALAAEAKLIGGARRTFRATLAFDEHGQFERNLIIRVNGQRTMWAEKGLWCYIEFHRGRLLSGG